MVFGEDSHKIMEVMNQIIFAVLDKDGRYVFVTEAWSRYTGISADVAKKRYVWDVYSETYAREVLTTGKPAIGKNILINGQPSYTNYYPLFDEHGNVDGVYLYSFMIGMDNALELASHISKLYSQLDYYKEELAKERGAKYGINQIVGSSKAVRELKSQIAAAARSASSVLIEGETGTGKELIAHSIHALSARRANNFVRVNCSAIPSELMESEFFGYAAGAFTGASAKGKTGRFALANNGSMFLDEINLLSSIMQPKFLRVLQEMEIEPVGSGKTISIDVRMIVASNVPLEKLVAKGDFRQDLYYRLNVIRIVSPPLRERKEDIPELLAYTIKNLNRQFGMTITGYDPDVVDLLMNYDWPGNIRELRNVVESAMNMTTDLILHRGDFGRLLQRVSGKQRRVSQATDDFSMKRAVERLETDMIRQAMKATSNNRKRAAELLGLSRTVFYDKLKKYGLLEED